MGREKVRKLRHRRNRVRKLRHLKARLAQEKSGNRSVLIEKIMRISIYPDKDIPK